MKLYATVTSERASKGQGGNDKLEIDVLVFDRVNPRYHITVTQDEFIVTERGYSEPRMYALHKDIRKQEELKGNKQKGEHNHDWSIKHDDGTYWCNQCDATKDQDGGIIE